jgi:hypothetical protein
MQLRGTRLCLDCEELHTEDRCPICASEAFAFLTRWVPVDERRRFPRPPAQPNATLAPRMSTVVKGGVAGLALLAAARWMSRPTRPGPAEDRRSPDESSKSKKAVTRG